MDWIRAIVESLTNAFNTRDVYKLVEYLNIVLIIKDLPHPVKGRFFRDIFANEYIFVSNNLDIQKEIVIAHELGHAVLHDQIRTSCYLENHLQIKSKLESQANKFAAELLIPDGVIDSSPFEAITINQLSCFLGVPEELVKLKFKTKG